MAQDYFVSLKNKYKELKEDSEKLADYGQYWLRQAIQSSQTLLERWPLDDMEKGPETKQAIRSALEAINDGSINDGVPRLIWVMQSVGKSTIVIRWIESDFDTTCLVFAPRDNTEPIVRYFLFEDTNTELLFMFMYYRSLSFRAKPINELSNYQDWQESIDLKYPVDEAIEGLPTLFKDWDKVHGIVYIPKGEFDVWVEDAAGNVSNKLEMLKPDKAPEPSAGGDIHVLFNPEQPWR